jgi:hypothetical protein
MKEILKSFYKVLENFKQEQQKKDKSATLKLIEKITFLGGIYVSSDGFEILFKIPKISIANDETFLKKCAEDFKLQGLTLKVKKI